MAGGDWTDIRDGQWFFRAVLLSAKIRSMGRNQDNLLTVGQQIGKDYVDTRVGNGAFNLSSRIAGRFPGLYYITSSETPMIVDIAFSLHPDFPCNQLEARVFVEVMGASGGIDIYLRDPPGAVTPGTLITDLQLADITAGIWNEFPVVDISGWAAGNYQIGIHYKQGGSATELECSPVHLLLTQTEIP